MHTLRQQAFYAVVFTSLAGCAFTPPEYARGDFEVLVAAIAGTPSLNPDFAPGIVKQGRVTALPLKMFDQWCQVRKGWATPPQSITTYPPSVVEFVKAFSERSNAAQARLEGWTPSELLVCVNRADGDRLLAGIFVEPNKRATVDSESGQTVALFDYQQAAAFSKLWAVRATERAARVNLETQRYINQQTEQFNSRRASLRANPKVGEYTSLGLIVEIKPPLVLIQHHLSSARVNSPMAWYRIDQLDPP